MTFEPMWFGAGLILGVVSTMLGLAAGSAAAREIRGRK